MSDPDTILDEIHAIRRQIYEIIKDMTPEEHVEYIRKETEPIIKKYGMKVVSKEEQETLRRNARRPRTDSN